MCVLGVSSNWEIDRTLYWVEKTSHRNTRILFYFSCYLNPFNMSETYTSLTDYFLPVPNKPE